MAADQSPVERDTARFLNESDHDEARQERINYVADALFAGECFPLSPDNFREAICEVEGVSIAELCRLLKAENYAGAGVALSIIVHGYWGEQAKKIAACRVDFEMDREVF